MNELRSFTVVSEIVQLNTMQPEVKKVKLCPPENFDCNANFAFELQEEALLEEGNKLKRAHVEHYENTHVNVALSVEFSIKL